jgi:hypothetical protein
MSALVNRNAAVRYITRIRNPQKRTYAEAYLAFLALGGVEPARGSLSYMAAQGVRLNLLDILKVKADGP